ncbi:MAG: SPASM domain-containing protein [Pirellulales bacterium]|nr:SPASM domain-containing protein [Pirellulales bacterium]
MDVLRTISSQTVCRTAGAAMECLRGRFPPVVRIETTNACNARCTICPHRRLQRPIVRMEEPLYRRLIDQCVQHGCREVHLHNFGEPLLDKHLEERIAYAKQRGIPKVKIFSNGSLLTEERSRGLIQSGLDEIKISFDGATPEEFEAIRTPLKFDTVVQNVVRLAALRNAARAPLRISVNCCSTGDREGTMQALAEVVDRFYFDKIHNWGDGTSTNGRHRLRKPCSRLWRTLTVLADGRVALCCLDYEGQHELGRADAAASLTEIWNGPAYRAVRRLHRAGRQHEIELCRSCEKSFW